MAHITDVLKKPVLTEKSLLLQQNENKKISPRSA